MKNKTIKRGTALLGAILLIITSDAGALTILDIWRNKAGDLPGTAQVVTLTDFNNKGGSIGNSFDIDMFAFKITTPLKFYATTVGTSGKHSNTQLFLFNKNDKDSGASGGGPGSGSGQFTAGAPYNSLSPGFYNSAISGHNLGPSASAGTIFGHGSKGIDGSTGPGGSEAVSVWQKKPQENSVDAGPHLINPTPKATVKPAPASAGTGTGDRTVAEPASILLLVFGLLALVSTRRCMTKVTRQNSQRR